MPARPTLRRPAVAVNTALGVLLLAGGFWAYRTLAGDDTPAAAASTRTVAVQEGTVTKTVTADGTVESASTATASFATGGTVTSISVRVGQKVTKGQVLARLSQEMIVTQEASNVAAVARAEAAIVQARSQIVQAEAASVEAKQSLERAQSLAKTGNATAAVLVSQGQPIVPLLIRQAITSEVLLGQANVGFALALEMIVVVTIVMVAYNLLLKRTSRWMR